MEYNFFTVQKELMFSINPGRIVCLGCWLLFIVFLSFPRFLDGEPRESNLSLFFDIRVSVPEYFIRRRRFYGKSDPGR